MPDLLSHVFIAYALCTVLALGYDWLDSHYVTVGMAGAFVPDLAKVHIVVADHVVGNALGQPFGWLALHTVGGTALSVGIGITLAASAERRRVGALLALGAASHLAADALLLTASGRTAPLLWPLTDYVPPTPGLYLSSDPLMSVLTGLVALAAWATVRRQIRPSA